MLKLVFVLVLVNACYAKAPSKRSVECPENEILVECAHCGPKSCSELGFRSPCQGASAGCKEQCVCDDSFVRNDKGICIDKKDCPSCGGDPNAVSGCGNHCGNSCSDYHQPNKTCRTGCRYNSCDCRKGFVFDDDVGKCVLKEKCSKSFSDYESKKTCRTGCPRGSCLMARCREMCAEGVMQFDEPYTELDFLMKKYKASDLPKQITIPRGIKIMKKDTIVKKLVPLMPESRRTFWIGMPTNDTSLDLQTEGQILEDL